VVVFVTEMRKVVRVALAVAVAVALAFGPVVLALVVKGPTEVLGMKLVQALVVVVAVALTEQVVLL
jgi:hypothetical protein